MANLLESVQQVINRAADEMLTNEIPKKSAQVINTIVEASFNVMEEVCITIKDLTKKETPDP